MGALTSKPHAFFMRSWELRRMNTISIIDSWGYNIAIGYRGTDIIRILPNIKKNNQNWIPDTIRYMYDGIRRNRLKFPSFKQVSISLRCAIYFLAQPIINATHLLAETSYITTYVGYSVDLETLLLMKQYFLMQPIITYLYSDHGYINNIRDFRADFLFSSTPDDLELTDIYLVLGTDLRMDAPLIATHIISQPNIKVINAINFRLLPIHCFNIGYKFINMIYGTHSECYLLTHSKNINIIHGVKLANDIHFFVKQLNNNLVFSKMLETENQIDIRQNTILAYANHAIFYEIAFDSTNNNIKLYNMNNKKYNQTIFIEADEADSYNLNLHEFAKVYIGAHFDVNASKSDLILPVSAYTEYLGTYINTTGNLQNAYRIFDFQPKIPTIKEIILLLVNLWNYTIRCNFPIKVINIFKPIIAVTTYNLINMVKVEGLYNYIFGCIPKEINENILTNTFEVNTLLRMSPLLALASQVNQNILY